MSASTPSTPQGGSKKDTTGSRFKARIKVQSVSDLPTTTKGLVFVTCGQAGLPPTASSKKQASLYNGGQIEWQDENCIAKLTCKIKEKEEIIVSVLEEIAGSATVLFQTALDLIPWASKVKVGGKKSFPVEAKGKKNVTLSLVISVLREDAGSGKGESTKKSKLGVSDADSEKNTLDSPTRAPSRVSRDGKLAAPSPRTKEKEPKKEKSKEKTKESKSMASSHKDKANGRNDNSSQSDDTEPPISEAGRDSKLSPAASVLRDRLKDARAKQGSHTMPHLMGESLARGSSPDLRQSKDDSVVSGRIGDSLPPSITSSPFLQPRSLHQQPPPTSTSEPVPSPGLGASKITPMRSQTFNLRMVPGFNKEDVEKAKLKSPMEQILNAAPAPQPAAPVSVSEPQYSDSIAAPTRALSTSSARLIQNSKSRPTKYNTLATSTLQSQEDSAPSTPTTTTPSSPLPTSAAKYPTLGARRKIVTTEPDNSPNGRHRTMSDAERPAKPLNGIDVASLKKAYAQKQREEDEKFLEEDVIQSQTLSDVHVIAVIIFKSLIHWEAFVDAEIPSRVVEACKSALQKFEGSRTMLFQWLSTSLTLLYMAEEQQKMKVLSPEEEPHLQEFIVQLRALSSEAFELVLRTVYKRLEPVLTASMSEALNAVQDSEKLVQETGLGDVLSRIWDFVPPSAEHCVFDAVRKQFFRRIFHFLTASLLDLLCREKGNSYGVGIQLKMILTRIEEWARTKVGHEFGQLANEELEAARQAANVLCLLKKADLTQESTRITVCPKLRPAHVRHILQAYKPDQFDKEILPASLLQALDKQELTFTATATTFNPLARTPLELNFEMPPVDLTNIALPKLVVDRSGFSFLKSGTSSNVSTVTKHKERW